LRPPRHRTHKEELLQPQVAVKNVAFGQSIGSFQVERRQDLPRQDRARNIGRVLRNLLQYAISQKFALLVPVSFTQFVRHVLNEAGQDMFSRRRERRIRIRRHHAIDPQLFRDVSKLGGVITALGEFERGHQRIERPLKRQEEWLQISCQPLQLIIHLHETFRISGGNLRELLPGSVTIGPPRHNLAIRKRYLNRRIARDHAQSTLAQSQLADDFRPQHARDIRSRRSAATRRHLFRHAAPAHNFSSLEYQGGQSGAPQICGGGEPIVPCADYDRVANLSIF